MSKTRYKLGGETTCAHPYCPASVLLRGRCRKECPYWSFCSGGGSPTRELGIDHVGLETCADGSLVFISCTHCLPPDAEIRLRDFCQHHGLNCTVDRSRLHHYGEWSYEVCMKISKKEVSK